MIVKRISDDIPVSHAYFLNIFLRFLLKSDIQPSELFKGTHLSMKHFADDVCLLNVQQHKAFILNAIAATNDAHIGIKFGQQLSITSMGIFGYALMSSATIKASLETMIRYYSMYTPLFQPSLVVNDSSHRHTDDMALQYDEVHDLEATRYFFLSSNIAGAENILRFLSGQHRVITHVELACPEPKQWITIREQAAFPVTFNCTKTRIYFPKGFLSTPICSADSTIEQSAKRACDKKMQQILQRHTLPQQIYDLLMLRKDNLPALPQVAAYLNMSERNFRRKLGDHGTNFRTILHSVKKDIAIKYLTSTSKSIYQVAVELGYDDIPNFARAFKRWTGKTPSEFRK